MFRRFAGNDVDTANARYMGTIQVDSFKTHAHKDTGYIDDIGAGGPGIGSVTGVMPVPTTVWGKVFGYGSTGKAYLEISPNSGGGANGGMATNPTGGAETRPRNVAFHPRIHV